MVLEVYLWICESICMSSSSGHPFMRVCNLNFSNYCSHFIQFVLFLGGIAMCGFAYTIAIMITHGEPVKKIIIRSLDIITVVVPPALPGWLSVIMCSSSY